MAISARTVIIGFVAGALAVPIFHQGTIWLLHMAGQIPNFPWSLRPVPPYGVPALLNSSFWGGIWGIVFALVGWRIPVGNILLRGIVFGLLGPFLLGNGLIVPLIRGQALFFGLMPQRMLISGLIQVGFGLGLALFWVILGGRTGRR